MTDQPPPPDQPAPQAGSQGQDPGGPPHAQPPPDAPPYDQAAYDQASYGRDPYAPPYGQAPYEQQPPYGRSAYGQAPYGQPPYDQPPYDQPPYGAPPPGGQPPGGYDPRYGYGPPRPPAPAEDTSWAVFAYVGNVLIGFLPALIIYLVKKNTSPFTRFHAAQSMNYQLTLLIHILVALALFVPPAIVLDSPAFLIPLIAPYLEVVIASWWLLILGAVKAGKQEYYRFPTFVCFRMIR